MKITLQNRKNILQAVLVVSVVGALLNRDYPMAGLVVTLCGIGCYLAVNTSKTFRFLTHLRQTSARQRLKMATYAVLVFIFVNAVLTHTVRYFLLLLVLGIDYFIYTEAEKDEPPKPSADEN